MKLPRDFYNRDTVKVAQELLGKFLVRCYRDPSTKLGAGKLYRAEIIETEVYQGFKDKASHASRGVTARNKIMFGPAGFAYVYLIYGLYHCLNIVTEKEGFPAAVLIRGLDYQKADGPGKLCRQFQITKKENGLDLTGDILWVEDLGLKVKFAKLPRVGVDYAGECKDWLRRFKVKNP